MSGIGSTPANEWRGVIRFLKLSGSLFGLVIVAVVAAAVINAPDDPGPGSGDLMSAVAPPGVLSPDEIPVGLTDHYEAAQTHFAIFEQIPCFCGCDEMLGHRHLGDCFVRGDGAGLEAHALGCGVCIGEATQVMESVSAGVTNAEQIRDAVVARWGDPYSSQ